MCMICMCLSRVRVPATVTQGCYTTHIIYTFSYVIRNRALLLSLSSRSDKASRAFTYSAMYSCTFDRWNLDEARDLGNSPKTEESAVL